MSRVYVWFIAIAMVLVSTTGAYFSVAGLTELFGGAVLSVAIMACALEFSKFVVVGMLYRYWGHIHRPLRAYLIFAVFTLMFITSVGIYGYLSNAYQISSLSFHSHMMGIESRERENQRVLGQIAEFRGFIDQIPTSRISRKFEFQKEYEPKIKELRAQSEKLVIEIDQKKQDMLSLYTKVGPAAYLAKVFDTDIDNIVKYLILIFVLVFDPLAVSLVFCLNLIIRLREKYKGDEYKIGAHSLTSPVDHRFKRAA